MSLARSNRVSGSSEDKLQVPFRACLENSTSMVRERSFNKKQCHAAESMACKPQYSPSVARHRLFKIVWRCE